ncbi:hypothetical protein OV079_02530 [Nannocystis pusilla]|uniref:Uncharacterized protein n=1 Tax=Nannocystis pusilla TaxID=889268 RepID=A0A9X3EI45_9BACT|nr:hypothetical protein [Nannocystis pusilla]MCY1004462.1 hypothetical protein [Nannocystis pusilla]
MQQDGRRRRVGVEPHAGAGDLDVALVVDRDGKRVPEDDPPPPATQRAPRVVVSLHVDPIAAHEIVGVEHVAGVGRLLVEVAEALHRREQGVAALVADHSESARQQRRQGERLAGTRAGLREARKPALAQVDELRRGAVELALQERPLRIGEPQHGVLHLAAARPLGWAEHALRDVEAVGRAILQHHWRGLRPATFEPQCLHGDLTSGGEVRQRREVDLEIDAEPEPAQQLREVAE